MNCIAVKCSADKYTADKYTAGAAEVADRCSAVVAVKCTADKCSAVNYIAVKCTANEGKCARLQANVPGCRQMCQAADKCR